MKKLLLLCALVASLYAGNVNWIKGYENAVKIAKSQNKPMLLFMNREDCGACQFMKEDVFTDEMIYSFINKNYVPVYINIYKNDAPEKFQVKRTPTFHFVRADNSTIQDSLIGGKTGKHFLKILSKAVELH